MKILHTADWHIGRSLYGKKRYDEFEAFLDWLAGLIESREIDALLVAGDIFDTTTPSNHSQELYYRFLCRVAISSACRHIVITGGNHDSPTFLNAPKELLRALHIHVVGSATDNPEDEVLVLCDKQGAPEMIVCAVPYLRDKDIRTAETGETSDDKKQKMIDGIRLHYEKVSAYAEQKRKEAGAEIPIVSMGHLFTAGAERVEGDGVRELYVGSLAHVTSEIFPTCVDYAALGHLHVPQKVDGLEHVRYCGSPIPMGFGEAKQKKIVCEVQFNGKTPSVETIDVPVLQKLEHITGDWNAISSRIRELSAMGEKVWLEITYDGERVISDLREQLENLASEDKVEILRIRTPLIIDRALRQSDDELMLDELDVNDVFEQCLAVNDVPEEQRPGLRATYKEAVLSLAHEDVRAE